VYKGPAGLAIGQRRAAPIAIRALASQPARLPSRSLRSLERGSLS